MGNQRWMVPKYVVATSRTSTTFPMALDNCSVIVLLIFDSRSLLSLKMAGIGNFGEEIRGGRLLTTVRELGGELGDELEEVEELRPP